MSKTITKKSLVETISDRTGQRRSDVKKTLQELLDQIVDELGEGNRIEFRDFGVFEVKERAARTAQNPRTLEPVKVPAKHTIKFKPGRKMKDVMDSYSDSIETGTADSGAAQDRPASEPTGNNHAVIATIEPIERPGRGADLREPREAEVMVTNHRLQPAGTAKHD